MERPRYQPRVLVVDSQAEMCRGVSTLLSSVDMSVQCSPCGQDATEALEREAFDVVVLFSCATGVDGLRTLSRARETQCTAEFVVVAEDGCAETGVHAMKLGAADYLMRPVEPGDLLAAVRSAAERVGVHRDVARLRRALRESNRWAVVARSRAMGQVLDLVERAAPTHVSVLVTGETGTGKELIARAVHDMSPRRDRGFVPVSCASVPEHLLESSLFGHTRGAFTGAVEARPGLFEQARGGTVLLDEIDCLRPELQPKLLRVLQERTVQRVGGRHDIPVEFRLVATSNVDLEEAVARGEFREDLFYRLSVFPIHLPPLRERPDDIPVLATHFRDVFAAESQTEPLTIPECCMSWLVAHPWPGNVRELKHTVERAMLLSDGGERIKCAALSHLAGHPRQATWERAVSERWDLERIQREYVRRVLETTDGNKGEAARILGVDRRTLYRWLRSWAPPEDGRRCLLVDGRP